MVHYSCAGVFSISATVLALNTSGLAWRAHRSFPRTRSNITRMAALPADARLPLLYGTAWKKDATPECVVEAVRSGFRGIDTACQPRHYREDLVGVALKRLAEEHGISRDDLWIQTKFTPLRGQDPQNVPYNVSAPLAVQVQESITKSLENLGTDRIDSLVLHSPLPTLEATLDVWRVFEQAVDQGIVRQLGISNCYDLRQFQSLCEYATIKPAVLQNRFYADTGYDSELRAFCLENGITYQSFWTISANPHILRSPAITRAASRLQATPAQVLFRWLIQSGHQPLTGTTSPIHMKENLAAAVMVLSSREMQEISRLFAPEQPGFMQSIGAFFSR